MSNLSKEDLKRLSEKYKDVILEGGINPILEKLLDKKSKSFKNVIPLSEIMAKHNLSRDDIAMIFGYANTHSYYTSKAKDKMNKGLELFYHLISTNMDYDKYLSDKYSDVWNDVSEASKEIVIKDLESLAENDSHLSIMGCENIDPNKFSIVTSTGGAAIYNK